MKVTNLTSETWNISKQLHIKLIIEIQSNVYWIKVSPNKIYTCKHV